IGAHEGVLRTQKMVYLAGDKTKEAVYTENGIQLKLNVETVYFSARSSTERKRIYQMVKPGEIILVMFSGCAPYPCVISKNTKANKIIGIELNPEGHKYGLENVKLNKLKNVELYEGDVRKVVPTLENKTFDRIIMPLPHTADDFLDLAFSVAKKGTIIHMYDFMEEELPKASMDKIKKACEELKRDCEILELVKCGQFSPRTFRICVDFVMD
ncbi:MAG: class I SAM-dependent methyltransferase family protein, partial [Candidatus Nanoarchaeia archaeon]